MARSRHIVIKSPSLRLRTYSLTNGSGAAINIQSGKRVFVELKAGTENNLTDASAYSTVDGEDEKACFFSEGQLIFSGTGALTVTGNYKHGSVVMIMFVCVAAVILQSLLQ
mgnify:CR=1 FL=1